MFCSCQRVRPVGRSCGTLWSVLTPTQRWFNHQWVLNTACQTQQGRVYCRLGMGQAQTPRQVRAFLSTGSRDYERHCPTLPLMTLNQVVRCSGCCIEGENILHSRWWTNKCPERQQSMLYAVCLHSFTEAGANLLSTWQVRCRCKPSSFLLYASHSCS